MNPHILFYLFYLLSELRTGVLDNHHSIPLISISTVSWELVCWILITPLILISTVSWELVCWILIIPFPWSWYPQLAENWCVGYYHSSTLILISTVSWELVCWILIIPLPWSWYPQLAENWCVGNSSFHSLDLDIHS